MSLQEQIEFIAEEIRKCDEHAKYLTEIRADEDAIIEIQDASRNMKAVLQTLKMCQQPNDTVFLEEQMIA